MYKTHLVGIVEHGVRSMLNEYAVRQSESELEEASTVNRLSQNFDYWLSDGNTTYPVSCSDRVCCT